MSIGLKIKEVADASGFTSATLRYYEQIGLLPEVSRTPAGYRIYDQRTLDRLAFIARAKQLGCSLDEITGLTTAWDGGQCGPIQDQLRQLVAGKIATAQHQLEELAIFATELRQAATALERHRPEGACDTHCGCVSVPTRHDRLPPRSRPSVCRPNRRRPVSRRSPAPCRQRRSTAGSRNGNSCSPMSNGANQSIVECDAYSLRRCPPTN